MKEIRVICLTFLTLPCFAQTSIEEKIDSLLQQGVSHAQIPGVTLGIVKDGELIYHKNVGLMNLEYNLPFNDSTVFRLASVTKQFTSACIGILQRQSKLSVNDDIRKYIPELMFYGDTIRVKHLLNHTSGLRNYNVLLDLSGFDYQHQGYTNEMIEQLIYRQKGVNDKPGEKMLYSNTNYVLLALLVERVSGLKLHEFASQELFQPLGMTSTFYQNDLQQIIKNTAHSYFREENEFKQPKSLTLCVGAGGMVSSISDLTSWSQIFLNPAHQFSYLSGFINQVDFLNNGTAMQHARGMFVTTYKNQKTYNHSGRDLGMRTQYICVPDLNLAIIAFSNSEEINVVDLSYKILDLWVPETLENEAKEKSQYVNLSQKFTPVVGDYQELNSDLRMHVFMDDDTLYALSSLGSDPVKLRPNSKNGYSRFDNSSITYTFFSQQINKADLLVDFGGATFYFEKIELSKSPDKNLLEFLGQYYSKELNVNYELILSNDKLVLNYPNNKGLLLKQSQTDVFGANRRTKYSFTRNNLGEVIAFYIASEGTVKDILFEKIK